MIGCFSHRRRQTRFAVTLLEMLASLTIISLFLTGTLSAFVQILKATDQAQASMEAVAMGRTALDSIAVEIKQANFFPGSFLFEGVNNRTPPLTPSGASYGDGVDNDSDGQIDEERMNGIDDDGDWTLASDRHIQVSAFQTERADFVGLPDIGDAQVDEDPLFEGDWIRFIQFADPSDPLPEDREIIYSLGQFDGIDNVLLQTIRRPALSPNAVEEISPLAQNVLSFNALYWQPNGATREWLESWDSSGVEALTPPGIRLPAAVRLTLHIYADPKPFSSYVPGEPIRVQTLTTIITIEQVINDSRYPRP